MNPIIPDRPKIFIISTLKGWTLNVHFQNPITNGIFQTYYGRDLSTDKDGTFISFTSFEDETSRNLGTSSKSYKLSFALFSKNDTTNLNDGNDVIVEKIEITIGEYANLQCKTDRNIFDTAGIRKGQNLVRVTDETDLLEPIFDGTVPFEFGNIFGHLGVCDSVDPDSESTGSECDCENGSGNTSFCTSNPCSSCDAGYEIMTENDPFGDVLWSWCQEEEESEISEIECKCQNGIGNSRIPSECDDSTNDCQSCHSSFRLVNNECQWKRKSGTEYFHFGIQKSYQETVTFCKENHNMRVAKLNRQEDVSAWHRDLKNYWQSQGDWQEVRSDHYFSWMDLRRYRGQTNHQTKFFFANVRGEPNLNNPNLQFNLWNRQGQPDDRNGNEECVAVYKLTRESFYSWFDENCGVNRYVVCEMRS